MQKLFEQAPRPLTLDQELILATSALIKVLPGDLYVAPVSGADPDEHGDSRYSKALQEGYDDPRETFEVGVHSDGNPYAYVVLAGPSEGTVATSTGYVVESNNNQVETREYHAVSVADAFDAKVKELMESTTDLSPQYAEHLTEVLRAARTSWDADREPTVYPRDMLHEDKLSLLAILRARHAEYVNEEREEPEEA